MSELPELKPCPFCGLGKSRVSLYEMNGYWRISCGACGSASGILPVKYQNARKRLIKSWNSRPDGAIRPPGSDADLANSLRAELKDLHEERVQLEQCMRRAQKMLEVPAAEYVPAINDAWEELQRGLQGSFPHATLKPVGNAGTIPK